MDKTDTALLSLLEQGLLLVPCPFASVAKRLLIPEEEVITRIAQLKQEGVIRKFRARINQRALGIDANALVGWNIGDSDPDSAGEQLAAAAGVSHCYCRLPVPGKWMYTHYTVHHGWSRDEIQREVQSIAKKTKFSDYIVLFSTDEYKRSVHVRITDLTGEI